jgi:hypothetical protein
MVSQRTVINNFEDLRKALTYQFLMLWRFLYNYDYLINIKDRDDPVYNRYEYFFETLRVALWTSIIIWNHRLTGDKDEKACGIHQLLNYIRNNTEKFTRSVVTEKMVDDDLNEIDNNPSFKIMSKRRHQYYAHPNTRYCQDIELLNKECPLDDWKGYLSDLEGVRQLYNKYSQAYDGKDGFKHSFDFTTQNIGDQMETICEILRRHSE